jgi:hypothetical protein
METRNAAAGAEVASQGGQGRPTRKTLWAVQDKGGESQPLIFVLAGYGDAWVAQGLARALGPEQTVYALQPPSESTAKTARELATLYLCGASANRPAARSVLPLRVQRGRSDGPGGWHPVARPGRSGGSGRAARSLFIRYTRFEHLCYHALQRVCRAVEKILTKKVRILQILAAMFEDKGLDIHLDALAGYKPDHYPGYIVFYSVRWAVGVRPCWCSNGSGSRAHASESRRCRATTTRSSALRT